jgi:oligosaccharide repeat unit polymerase
MSSTTVLPMSDMYLNDWGHTVRLAWAFTFMVGCILMVTIYPNATYPLACLLALASLVRGTSLVGGFVFLAAIHCTVGYPGAFVAGELIFTYFNHADIWYAKASFAIALGLFAMSTGYKVSDHSGYTWVDRIAIDEVRLRKLTKLGVLAGTALMISVYAKLSVLEIMLGNISEMSRFRYLGGQERSDVYIMARALDVLTYTLPLLWVLRTRRSDLWVYIVGMAAFLLPLRRASFFAVLLIPFLVKTKGFKYRNIFLALLLLMTLYYMSQLVFLDTSKHGVLTILGSALPEVRDLAWSSRLMNGKYLNGATFFQQLNPLPAFMSESKRTSTMEYITADLLGYDPDDRKFAGLRTTLAGEAFLNFWFFGPPVFGFLLGKAAAWAERSWRFAPTLPSRYLAATLLTWVCFWIYMGGTQAWASVKMGAVVTGLIFYLARRRKESIQLNANPA